MKLKANKIFSYPILHMDREDYINESKFEISVEDKSISNKLMVLEIKTTLNDNKINSFLAEKKFIQLVHIECPRTKFRKIYTLNYEEKLHEITIDFKLLNGLLEVSSMIVSDYDGVYNNETFIQFYRNYDIEVTYGNIIAASNTYYTNILKESMEFENVESCFSIKPSKEHEFLWIDPNGDKITIEVPKKVFEDYYDLNDNINKNISSSILVVPAIIRVLELLEDEETNEVYSNKKWYKTFESKLKSLNHDIENYHNNGDKDLKYKLAQELLENSTARALETLKKITKER